MHGQTKIKYTCIIDKAVNGTVTTLRPITAQWLLYVPPGVTLEHCTLYLQSAFLCFVWIWEQTANFLLHNSKLLVFVNETVCLLRGTSWVTNRNKANLSGVAPAFSRRHVIAEARVQSQATLREVCAGKYDSGTVLSLITSVVTCQYHSVNAPCSSSSTCCYMD